MSKAVRAGNEAALQRKNFSKVMKLFGFSYRMGEAKKIKVGREDCKSKYYVASPSPRSHLPELVEEENLLLSDIDSDDDDEVIPCKADSAPCTAAFPAMGFANSSVELEGIEVVISNPVVDEKISDGSNLYFF